MESRPDLVPPCCAACFGAGVADVTWDEQAGWQAQHGIVNVSAASGVEAMNRLRDLHYSAESFAEVAASGRLPEPAAVEPVTSTTDIDLGDHHG